MKRKASLVAPSTRAFVQEARKVHGFKLFDILHGYVYARWPYLYIGIGTGEHRLAKLYLFLARIWARVKGKPGTRRKEPEAEQPHTRFSASMSGKITFADTYHGKVVPLEAARQLVMVNEPVKLENLETIIPYARARDIILQNSDHIVALECPCRAGRRNPCKPLDVCLIVGEPFASFVAEHHVRRSRWITQEEAVRILKAEDEHGHVHHAFFKDAMLERFYAICNCCSCCCGAMQAQRNHVNMLASSGYVCQVDESLCIGCGECHDYCQFRALSFAAPSSDMASSNEDQHTRVDREICMGCGVCVSKCEQGALELARAADKGEPLEIARLIEEARS